MPVLSAILLLLWHCSAELHFHVDCAGGLDSAPGSAAAPFRTVHRAQRAIRGHPDRARAEAPRATVHVAGLCQLPTPLVLGPADSNTRYVGAAGAILSGGTRIDLPSQTGGSQPIRVDLRAYNFTTQSIGKLTGRGYSGGSVTRLACILVDNFEQSAAELFYRPPGPNSAAGARAYGPAQEGMTWLARSPNRAPGGRPAATDWAGVTSVSNLTLTIAEFESELPSWRAELEAGRQAYLHGLWAWNWADSHRPLLSISGTNITVGNDDIGRDVSPIHPHKPAQQGGYVYAYGLEAMLDAPGEYFIDPNSLELSFLPPEGSQLNGSYSVSRLGSVVLARAVSNVSFEQLEIRYSRGAGVRIQDSHSVLLEQCTVSDHGMMGVNITGGSGCGVKDSEIAANGDAGVVLAGGDRITLTPSRHFVRNCTVHHNHRWIMNFSPDVMLAGVGQSVEDSEVFGSPHFAVFYQGNDHTMIGCHLHDAGRECSDCAAFYSGREWTYRGSRIVNTRFSNLSSIFPKAHGMPSAVYLDDQLSSVRIEGCVFDQIPGSVMLLGGGRHNQFVNNLIKQSADTQHISMDSRGGGGTACCTAGRLPYEFLWRVPFNSSAAWSKYPDLPNILDDQPCTPKHNEISNNVLCGGARNFSLDPATVAAWGSEMRNNTAVVTCPQEW